MQIEAVRKKLMELNPGFDGKVTGADGVATPQMKNGTVDQIRFDADNVTDVSPVRALPDLTGLQCGGSGRTNCKLNDLSPLQGMPLTNLVCSGTNVSDLSPLLGMKLTNLRCGFTRVADLSPLRECQTLKSLFLTGTKVTPASVAALQKALPNCKIEWDGVEKGLGTGGQGPVKTWETPAFQQWIKATQALPAEKQLDAVSKKLMELNPRFDGMLTGKDGDGTPQIHSGIVRHVGLVCNNVTDVSPLRAFDGLNELSCVGNGQCKFSDLSAARRHVAEALVLSAHECRRSFAAQGNAVTVICRLFDANR